MKSIRAFAFAALLSACSPVQQQDTLYKPAATGKPYLAGPGDTVLDLKQTQSLPNAMGRADVFGRTRDAGRVTVRFLGVQGNTAYFARQDVVIQSNDTTMTRTPMPMPTYQTTSGSGYIGNVPISGGSTTTGLTYLPAPGSTSFPMQAGQIQLTAPIGGSALVEGRRLNARRAVDGGLEYSVD